MKNLYAPSTEDTINYAAHTWSEFAEAVLAVKTGLSDTVGHIQSTGGVDLAHQQPKQCKL